MAAKEVRFSDDARAKMLAGTSVLNRCTSSSIVLSNLSDAADILVLPA